MAFSPRNPKATRTENRCLDVYSSDSDRGGVIYELNFAIGFPMPGAPVNENELFSNIHGRIFYQAYQPAWQELMKKEISMDDAFERMCFIEFNVLVVITEHLNLDFEKVHKNLMSSANSFAKKVRDEWIKDRKNSIDLFALKKYKESYKESSFLWKKEIQKFWSTSEEIIKRS